MIATTHHGDPAWLVPYEPAWRQPVSLRATVPSEVTRSLTGREIRQRHGVSLRLTLRWEAVLTAGQLAQLRDALAVYADEPVLVPLWPFATSGAGWPGPAQAAASVGWQDGWTSHAIDPVAPSAWHHVAPLLVGRITVELPSLPTPGLAVVVVTFEEDAVADEGVTLDAATWATGPALNDATTPPVFPFTIDWGSLVRSVGPAVVIERRSIGLAPRTRAAAAYPQSGATPTEGSVVLTSQAEVGRMLRWWQDRGGASGAQYATTHAHITDIAAEASAGSTTLTVADASRLGAYRFLAVDDGTRVQWVRVLSIAGNVLTLQSALTHAVGVGSVVAVAVLARHAADDLEISCTHAGLATARLAWEEVAEEYLIAAGETRGTTIGAGTLRAWLYRITVDRLGNLTTYRRTSFERDLTVDAETWEARPIGHSALERSVRLDRDEVSLEARTEAWASVFLPGNLTARVTVDILECDVSGSTGSNAVNRWSGEVNRVSFDGPFVRAACVGPYSVFDRKLPRVLLQPGCNHTVYDARCGLAAADWTFSAAVHATVTSRTVVLKTWSRTLGLPVGWGFAGYFALGYLSRGHDRWLVLSSSAVSGGLVTLTLDRVATWTADEAVTVVPGCDGRRESCMAYHAADNPEGKFGNYARFLGFPFVPPKNPSFTIPKSSGSGYGKK